MKAARTAKQKAALREAYEILSIFDEVLVVTALESDFRQSPESAPGHPDPDVYWKGNWLLLKGLSDYAKDRLDISRRNKHAPH